MYVISENKVYSLKIKYTMGLILHLIDTIYMKKFDLNKWKVTHNLYQKTF